jgi:hypothetical protein
MTFGRIASLGIYFLFIAGATSFLIGSLARGNRAVAYLLPAALGLAGAWVLDRRISSPTVSWALFAIMAGVAVLVLGTLYFSGR